MSEIRKRNSMGLQQIYLTSSNLTFKKSERHAGVASEAWVPVNLSLRRSAKKKKVLEHYQIVKRPRKGIPGWWATAVWCTSTNF